MFLFGIFVCLIMFFLCVHFLHFLCVLCELLQFFVSAFFSFFVRGVNQENSLVYAMYVYASYVHRAVVR